jgi:hypothetical protein
MISGIKQFFLTTTFTLALANPLMIAAVEKSAPVSSGDDPTSGSSTDKNAVDRNETIKNESKQPMNLDEPMPTGMAKKGMKKGDVKAHAKKKDATMDEMMKQEVMKK